MVAPRRATLEDAAGWRWELRGDADPAADVRWIVEGVSGWFGGAEVRSTITPRLRHGDFVSRAWRGTRSMTLSGAVECSTPQLRDQVQRELSGIAWEGDWATLTCEVDGLELSTQVRLDGIPQIVQNGTQVLRFQVPLRSESPFLYGENRTVFLQPVGAGIGLEYPLFGGDAEVLTYGSAIAADDKVVNQGTATAYPSFLVVGDFPGGFRITEGPRTVEWPWPVVMEAPVQIESKGSVWIGDANVTSRATIRQWMPIEAGATIAPRLHGLQGGTGWCEVHHSDTYI